MHIPMCEQCGGAITRPMLALCACRPRRKKPIEPSTSAPKARVTKAIEIKDAEALKAMFVGFIEKAKT